MHNTDVREVTTALRETSECSAEIHRLEGLGDALEIQRNKEELKSELRLQKRHTFEL